MISEEYIEVQRTAALCEILHKHGTANECRLTVQLNRKILSTNLRRLPDVPVEIGNKREIPDRINLFRCNNLSGRWCEICHVQSNSPATAVTSTERTAIVGMACFMGITRLRYCC